VAIANSRIAITFANTYSRESGNDGSGTRAEGRKGRNETTRAKRPLPLLGKEVRQIAKTDRIFKIVRDNIYNDTAKLRRDLALLEDNTKRDLIRAFACRFAKVVKRAKFSHEKIRVKGNLFFHASALLQQLGSACSIDNGEVIGS
jgi:hypothetical protein